jgi:hypothetical protein
MFLKREFCCRIFWHRKSIYSTHGSKLDFSVVPSSGSCFAARRVCPWVSAVVWEVHRHRCKEHGIWKGTVTSTEWPRAGCGFLRHDLSGARKGVIWRELLPAMKALEHSENTSIDRSFICTLTTSLWHAYFVSRTRKDSPLGSACLWVQFYVAVFPWTGT